MDRRRSYSNRKTPVEYECTKSAMARFPPPIPISSVKGLERGRGRGRHYGRSYEAAGAMKGRSSFPAPHAGLVTRPPVASKKPLAAYYASSAPLPNPPPPPPLLRRPSHTTAAAAHVMPRRVALPRPHIVAPPPHPPRHCLPNQSPYPSKTRRATHAGEPSWGPVPYAKTSESGGTTRYGISGKTYVKRKSYWKSSREDRMEGGEEGEGKQKGKRVYAPGQRRKRRKEFHLRLLWNKLLYENFFFMEWREKGQQNDQSDAQSGFKND